MKQVYSASDEVDAAMAKNFLANAGIEAVVQEGGLGNVLGEVLSNEQTLPSIWVRDEDFDRAAAAMRDFRQAGDVQGAPWTCPNCGESIEPQFEACWKCGTGRPSA